MKQAIIGLDGGGSNLRMLIVDKETEKEIYSKEISTGTNLSTVANKKEALDNIISLILDGYLHIPRDYILTGVGLSSAGTEIKENKIALEGALRKAIETLKISSDRINENPPELYITNDIDILLHSADIALVAGTGTVGAVKYKDVKPYDNEKRAPEYTIKKLDGRGQFLGDKGAGFWLGNEALKRVSEIENLGHYIDSKGRIVKILDRECPYFDDEDRYLYEEEIEKFENRTDKIKLIDNEDVEIAYASEKNLCLKNIVFEKLFEELGISKEELDNVLKYGLEQQGFSDYVDLIYKATEANKKPYDRAKVGNIFSKTVDEAAMYGDKTANDILKHASVELFKLIKAAYETGNFYTKENCDILLSGSVLVHSEIIRTFLESIVKQYYPNVNLKVNNEKPVWSTIRYVKDELDKKERTKLQDEEREI